MADGTHVTRVAPQSPPDRYKAESSAESNEPTGGWRRAALEATTLGELYDAARKAQATGEWVAGDAEWCALLRELLGVGARALALVKRELGAVEVTR